MFVPTHVKHIAIMSRVFVGFLFFFLLRNVGISQSMMNEKCTTQFVKLCRKCRVLQTAYYHISNSVIIGEKMLYGYRLQPSPFFRYYFTTMYYTKKIYIEWLTKLFNKTYNGETIINNLRFADDTAIIVASANNFSYH